MNLRSRLLLSVIIFLFTLSFTYRPVQAFWFLNSYGEIVNSEGFVLGDEDRQEKSEDSSDEDSEDSSDESDEVDETDEVDEAGDIEYESEIQVGNTKIKIERRGTKLTVKREVEGVDDDDLDDEHDTEIELEDGGIFAIEQHRNQITTRLATGSGEFLYFMRGSSAAKTDFPLSINPDTNELIVTTPAGEKIVTVLPDQAVANMLAQNVLDKIDTPDDNDLPESEEVGDLEESFELTETEDGELVYKIDGEKDEKILGAFSVKIHKTAIVSAETGELLATELTFFQRLLDLVSF